MNTKRTRLFFRIVSLILVFCFACPIQAFAVEPRASYYLESYNSYPYAAGNGVVQVWFVVTGVKYMADIGALNIQVYESTDNTNWTWVKTYKHTTYTDMLGHDKYIYQSHIDHQGVVGRYYKAYVCIYAGDGTNGDTRYFWIGSVQAT